MVVINLGRSETRLKQFRQRSGVPAALIPRLQAIDGQPLQAETLMARGLIDATVQSWPKGQLGCALSHLKAWMHCRRSGQPLLIFEDDALFAANWRQRLGHLMDQAPGGWDLLLLGWNMDSCLQVGWGPAITATALFQPRFPAADALESSLNSSQEHLWFPLHKALGLAGYVLSAAGAARLLSWSLPLRTLPIEAPDLPPRPCFSLDGQLNSLYPQIAAHVCVPPLVVGANDKPRSLTSR